MNPPKPTKTIDQVLDEFLAEQKGRLSANTFRKYDGVVDLLKSCLERYWPGHDQKEYDRITAADGTFCGSFGPEEILHGLDEFLGYFMPHKVIAGRETMKAAGTVTKKLVRWLAEKGYAEDVEAAEERASEAATNLPASQEAADLLQAYADEYLPARYTQELEDHFTITRIEPGKLWLEPFTSGPRAIGPIPVPHQVTRLCKVGWDIGGTVAKTGKGWRFVEVWNVAP